MYPFHEMDFHIQWFREICINGERQFDPFTGKADRCFGLSRDYNTILSG